MEAKELVNSFYQPLGFLHCQVSNDMMWQYAKARAIECVDAILDELNQLRKPEYTTFITSYEKGEDMDGYQKIAFYENLKLQISKL